MSEHLSQKAPAPASPADLQALLAAADELADKALALHPKFRHAPAMHAALLWTLAYTGLRISKALALTWADVDLEARQLRVRRRYRDKELGDPKSESSARTVALSTSLVARLRRWYAQCPHKGPDALAFGTAAGGFESDSNVRNRGLKGARTQAGIARSITPHDLGTPTVQCCFGPASTWSASRSSWVTGTCRSRLASTCTTSRAWATTRPIASTRSCAGLATSLQHRPGLQMK